MTRARCIGFGALTCVFSYPTIADRPFEILWALTNIGMIANITVWLTDHFATARLGLVGGTLAIAGHLLRVGISGVIEARPDARVDLPIVTSIMLMFIGLALLGVAPLRAHVLTGPPASARPP